MTASSTIPLRVGIAGAVRGGGFLDGLRSLGADRAVLAAVYDPDIAVRERFASAHGVATSCDSFEELLDASDLVVLSTPQHHHAPQAIVALERGIHVLSEVPAVVSGAQAGALVAAVRGSTARYGMAENYCYTRPNLIVRAMAQAGAFGELYYGEGEYLHEMKSWHTTDDGRRTWRHYWQVGRDGMTYPTHSLGPLLQWFDDRIVSVSCTGTGRHTDPEHVIQDSVVMLARTARGALLRTRFDLLSNRPHLMDYYAVQGTAGGYEAARTPGAQPSVYLEGISPAETWEPLESYADRFLPERFRVPPSTGGGHWGSDVWPIQEMVEAIEQERDPEIGIYEALDMTQPGLASEASIAQHGAWIHVQDPRYLTGGIGTGPGREAPLA